MELNYFNESKNENENINKNENENDFNSIINYGVKSGDNLILKKKKLIDISKNLSKLEYLEIFNIIQNDKCVYSENKNGIFINLSNVSEHTIDKIFNFIDFIKHKKEDLLKYEEHVNIAKNNISDIQKSVANNVISNEKEYNDNNNNYDISDSDSDEEDKADEYLIFSSDEDDDLENKLSLKKKKVKYSGKKAKMIKSIKDTGTNKLRNKKDE
jgi:hypothetical protein